MDTSFNLGYALSAVRIFKAGNNELANEFMYKSLFYSTRNLICFKTGELIVGYNNIYQKSKEIEIPDKYRELLELAYKLRNEEIKDISSKFYFKNISYINKFIILILEENL